MTGVDRCTPISDIVVCGAQCCAIQGCICKYPECCGCIVDSICCCIKTNMVMCKGVDSTTNEDQKCCICVEGGTFCVSVSTCCQQQSQMCCVDNRCALPPNHKVPCLCTLLPFCAVCAGGKCKLGCCKKVGDLLDDNSKQALQPASAPIQIAMANPKVIGNPQNSDVPAPEPGVENKVKNKEKDLTEVEVGELNVCCGLCCSLCSFFCRFPDCCGCKIDGICCCLQCEESMCKVINKDNDARICCIVMDGGSYCVKPTVCCQSQQHCFCIDTRTACPRTEKVPCIFTLLPFCVTCVDWECKVNCCKPANTYLQK